MRGHHDVLGAYRARRGVHGARRTLAHPQGARVLEDGRAIAVDKSGQPLDILDRVELQLMVQPDRAVNGEREVGRVDVLHGQPRIARRVTLLLYRAPLRLVGGVREGGATSQVAVDPSSATSAAIASTPAVLASAYAVAPSVPWRLRMVE